ncbi:cell division regulator GpsB [Paenisporosarcina sp. FSL H8-0542]|uniref:cell division regulator GpsB n=1 Tax=unclassified Paenisporosarcina TaxID=2642018 RepID=UPI00034E16B6|nr:cell division regulator GpsB [Paenisporosarcina sp. HGH0030]EPD53133.1 cell cycle protein gpsB [Paenisporosarcina sp. HGH0030]
MDMKLTPEVILEKEFKTGLRGYHQDEVDQFLDEVIQDYNTFMQTIETLKAENRRLRDELDEAPRRQVAAPSTGTTNFDILKRLSNLEKHVFGSKLYE